MRFFLKTIFPLLFLCVQFSYSQNSKTDSLEKLLLSEKQDTHCLSLMNELCRAYKNIGKTDSAKNYANKIISLAEQLSSKKYKSIGLQNLGLIHYENGEYEKAIRVYLDALKIKEETKDTTGIAFVLNNIGLVYQAQNKLKDALDYYQKSKSIIEQSENKNYESLRGLSNTYNNIGLINYYQYHFDTAIVCLQKGLELRQEINDQQKIAESYTNIGNVYFMNKEYRKAIQYYSESLNMVEKLGNKRNIAFLNLNLSELYDSIGNFSEGFRLLDTALALSQEINAKELMKECYARLASMYSQKEDYKNAYEFHKKYSDIKDTILNEESSKQIAEMQTKYETEKKEQQITLLNKDKELQDAQLNRQKIIIWSVAGGLLVVLILSVFIFRERRKSEKLLLNILPVETARELKVNGKATARHYESVTVMFTDFKGFTTIAEKLSAEELVSELDFLFKKFDEIISKYNIEKIKTIGDAYMCASGLPTPNSNHAEYIVKAALEIQEWMQSPTPTLPVREGESNTSPPQWGGFRRGLEDLGGAWQLRIGIHTGPVTAGVVGDKKFAYDIWGDTVNTASRMESSGEAGKINISGVTYTQLNSLSFWERTGVRADFRGKIPAKNKGEIEMYFVEKSIL